jgi:hypothetical protein
MTLREWMQSLYDEHGYLTSALVLEAARPPESAAHGYVFNVPPKEAAEGYYLGRAHQLIQTVRVQVVTQEKTPARPVRFYHAVASDDGGHEYLSVDDLVRRPDRFAEVRRNAEQRLHAAERALLDLDLIRPQPTTKRAARKVREARAAITAG